MGKEVLLPLNEQEDPENDEAFADTNDTKVEDINGNIIKQETVNNSNSADTAHNDLEETSVFLALNNVDATNESALLEENDFPFTMKRDVDLMDNLSFKLNEMSFSSIDARDSQSDDDCSSAGGDDEFSEDDNLSQEPKDTTSPQKEFNYGDDIINEPSEIHACGPHCLLKNDKIPSIPPEHYTKRNVPNTDVWLLNCNHCDFSAKDMWHLKGHMHGKHAAEIGLQPISKSTCMKTGIPKQILQSKAWREPAPKRKFFGLYTFSEIMAAIVNLFYPKQRPQIQKFYCDECEMVTKSESYLGEHKDELHTGGDDVVDIIRQKVRGPILKIETKRTGDWIDYCMITDTECHVLSEFASYQLQNLCNNAKKDRWGIITCCECPFKTADNEILRLHNQRHHMPICLECKDVLEAPSKVNDEIMEVDDEEYRRRIDICRQVKMMNMIQAKLNEAQKGKDSMSRRWA